MKRSIFSLLALVLAVSSCNKQFDPDSPESIRYYANTFAYNVMNTYYLWKDDIRSQLDTWKTNDDPVQKVETARYSMDKWTVLYEDYTRFESTMTGSGKTFGMDFSLYYYSATEGQICAIVTYTSENSPARKAGLKRGDVILTVDGEQITEDNYSAKSEKLLGDGTVSIGLEDGRTLTLQAIQMYENPVQTVSMFELGGKRFGYLHYTRFTLDSCKDLETVFGQFKAYGITDLVLDIRYNNGGYVTAAQTLASMIAPAEVVKANKVYNMEIYNDLLSETEDDTTRFETEVKYTSSSGEEVTVHPLEVNPGVEHLWVIVTGNSASASEAIICGLKPYMDVTLIGQQTYGKFTGGIFLPATTWFDTVTDSSIKVEEGKAAIPTWGMYVIISRYADCNGVTLSMPDGIKPDYEMRDAPANPTPLGDPSEQMLSATLSIATGGTAPASVKSVSALGARIPFHRPGFGVLLH